MQVVIPGIRYLDWQIGAQDFTKATHEMTSVSESLGANGDDHAFRAWYEVNLYDANGVR